MTEANIQSDLSEGAKVAEIEATTSYAEVAEAAPKAASRNSAIGRIPVSVQVVLGTTSMSIAELTNLSRGAVVRLDRRIGEPVDVMVNGRLVGRGEIVVLEQDETRFAVSLTEVVDPAASALA